MPYLTHVIELTEAEIGTLTALVRDELEAVFRGDRKDLGAEWGIPLATAYTKLLEL